LFSKEYKKGQTFSRKFYKTFYALQLSPPKTDFEGKKVEVSLYSKAKVGHLKEVVVYHLVG